MNSLELLWTSQTGFALMSRFLQRSLGLAWLRVGALTGLLTRLLIVGTLANTPRRITRVVHMARSYQDPNNDQLISSKDYDLKGLWGRKPTLKANDLSPIRF